MEICAICYERRPPIKFFYLSCCGNNKICSYCLENLVLPKCPYCRQVIVGFNNQKPRKNVILGNTPKRLSLSHREEESPKTYQAGDARERSRTEPTNALIQYVGGNSCTCPCIYG
jgi:hypothetical protein